MGVPKVIKTDNRCGYYSKAFHLFGTQWKNDQKTDIPYNPPGNGIVEHAHSS